MFNISEMTKSWLTLGLTSRWSVKFDHKLIESTKDGNLVLALDADAGLRKMLQTKTNKQKTTANKLEKSHMITYGCFLFIFPSWAAVSASFHVNLSGQRSRVGSITLAVIMRSIMQRPLSDKQPASKVKTGSR